MSYYVFTPGQVFSGLGGIKEEFNAEAVWADVKAGTPVKYGGQGNNFRGARAVRTIQVGLNALGYGPTPVNGDVGSVQAPWKAFMRQHKLSTAVGLIQKNGLVLMQELLRKGAKPGPGKAIHYKKVGGEWIPDTDKGGLATAGMGGAALVALLIIGGAAAYALTRDKEEEAPSTQLATL